MSNEYLAEFCDRLLGVDRNDPIDRKVTKKIKFYEDEVCKDYLLGLCPYLLLSNTKSDLGPCPRRIHDEELRESFESEGDKYREQYELSLFSSIHRIILDLQKRIRKAQARLEAKASEEVEQLLNPERDEMQERRATLDVQMRSIIQQLEEFAEKGRMKEVQELNVRLDVLRAESERIRANEESNSLGKQDRKMEVCRVCASFLAINDMQKRLEAHFEGKQHVGFQKIWDYYENYKKKYPSFWRKLEDSTNYYSSSQSRKRIPPSGYSDRRNNSYSSSAFHGGKRSFDQISSSHANSSFSHSREHDSRSHMNSQHHRSSHHHSHSKEDYRHRN